MSKGLYPVSFALLNLSHFRQVSLLLEGAGGCSRQQLISRFVKTNTTSTTVQTLKTYLFHRCHIKELILLHCRSMLFWQPLELDQNQIARSFHFSA